MKKLERSFYERNDVVGIAKELLGKILVANIDGVRTSGRIVETEAYAGASDKASHAYNNRRTNRTEIMFGDAGHAYVYLCYGIHQLFNIVTNTKGIPHAVLIRALDPVDGITEMLNRNKKQLLDNTLTRGPGNVSKCLGINRTHTGLDMLGDTIHVVDDGFEIPEEKIIASARIGVDYAQEDALLPYRFSIDGNRYVSKPPSRKVKKL